MRLDVGDPGAGHPAHRLERAQLVEHVGGEVGSSHVDAPAAEAREVAVGDVRADGHAVPGRALERVQHDERIPRVEAARHVGARDDVEHRVVVAEGPAAEGLGEVAVEVDLHGVSPAVVAPRRAPAPARRVAVPPG